MDFIIVPYLCGLLNTGSERKEEQAARIKQKRPFRGRKEQKPKMGKKAGKMDMKENITKNILQKETVRESAKHPYHTDRIKRRIVRRKNSRYLSLLQGILALRTACLPSDEAGVRNCDTHG